ncbi:MAG: ATPase, partial [Bacilli bacterium]|nr:ATPase [Bacilli bacterium]
NSYALPARNAWAGLGFESVCYAHLPQIKTALGISGVLTEAYSWSSKGGEDVNAGAQIDLVIDRKDRVVNLIEIKFSSDVFAIDKDYDAVLRNKITAFQSQELSRKSIQLTFITTFGLEINKYRNTVSRSLSLDDLFAF